MILDVTTMKPMMTGVLTHILCLPNVDDIIVYGIQSVYRFAATFDSDVTRDVFQEAIKVEELYYLFMFL